MTSITPIPLRENAVIMHIDLDAFFASCEEAKDPTLKGKPLVIGSDPKGGKGRGIVSTANYEARKFGIRSALPISRAYKACPEAVFLRGDFRLYRAVSQRFFEHVRSYGFPFIKTSVDEGYADLTELGFEEANRIAQKILL